LAAPQEKYQASPSAGHFRFSQTKTNLAGLGGRATIFANRSQLGADLLELIRGGRPLVERAAEMLMVLAKKELIGHARDVVAHDHMTGRALG
jgi:hypothetical protein